MPFVVFGFVTVRFHVPVEADAVTESVATSVVESTTLVVPATTERPEPPLLPRVRLAPAAKRVPVTVTGTCRVGPLVPVRPTTAGTMAVTVGFPETIVKASASVPDLPPSEVAWVTVTDRAPVVAALETVAVAVIVVASVTDTEVNDTPVPDAET